MALAKETYFSKVFLALIFICSVGCSKIEEDCLKYEYEVYRRDTMSVELYEELLISRGRLCEKFKIKTIEGLTREAYQAFFIHHMIMAKL